MVDYMHDLHCSQIDTNMDNSQVSVRKRFVFFDLVQIYSPLLLYQIYMIQFLFRVIVKISE